ncbi:MAG: terminase TerL endonuclease subunit [Faecousia sp.]
MTHYIQDYIDLVRSGTVPMCREQYQLVDLVERAFAAESLTVNEKQLEEYMGLQKHFPYNLLSWECFIFALHNCVYDSSGELRWPELVVVVGRGAGKNGYLSFEDFALLTPVNGIPEYDIDIFAMTEAQAKMSFDDIWNILEGKKEYYKRYFYWTKEQITNLKTNSTLRYHTSSPKSADGARPGKVDNDEVHAYENSKLMDTGTTGLGKKPHPRQTKITTMGDVRDGPLDRIMERAEKVLSGEIPDNGTLYFICRLDSDEEIHDPAMWVKANPSLYDPARPQLLRRIQREYQAWKEDPITNASFATKRMNRPMGSSETAVTSWENIKAACAPIPPDDILLGRCAVAAIDYASTEDCVTAGVLFEIADDYIFLQHTWYCLQSKEIKRIKFPLDQAAARDEVTLVDAPEIHPDLPAHWIREQQEKYNILAIGVDHYRYTLLSKALSEYGIEPQRNGGILKLTFSPEQSKVAPSISSAFLNHRIKWGDCMIMRWFTNNAIRILDKKGNITFGKIEPKTRKTDGFMCFVMCMICALLLGLDLDPPEYTDLPDVYVY